MFNTLTGETSNILISSTVTDILGIKVNYDGTKACILTEYNNVNTYYLYKYDADATTNIIQVSICASTANFSIQNDGGIFFYERQDDSSAYYYSPTGTVTTFTDLYTTSGTLNHFTACESASDAKCFYLSIFESNVPLLKKCEINENNEAVSSTIDVITTSSIGTPIVNSEGGKVFFISGGYVCSYCVSTNSVCNYNVKAVTLYKMIDGERIIARDSLYKYFIFNPMTEAREDIRPADITGATMTFDIDYSGEKLVYLPSDVSSLRMWDRSGNLDKTRYLLSFDGGNSWYSHKSGAWTLAESEIVPSADTLTEQGMTADEINRLTAADFAPLYQNGIEIYSVDAAVYFASSNPYITPSISSIRISTDKQSFNSANDSTATPLYTAKKTDFTGSQWRAISKIYPVEIMPKEANFLYFIYADGKYSYYDGAAWQTETDTEIADLIGDTEANWISLMQIGMSAQELRSIPETELTSLLAGKDFSVIYCMQVSGKSTAGYYSMINVDYTKDLFASASLALTVYYSDGTLQTFSGLTDTQVEDFMTWLNFRPNGKGTIYYSLTSGSTSYYINYYLIRSVSVVQN